MSHLCLPWHTYTHMCVFAKMLSVMKSHFKVRDTFSHNCFINNFMSQNAEKL